MSEKKSAGKKRLRVAQVIGRLSVGGAERHFVSLCNSLTDCDVFAMFVSDHGNGTSLRGDLADHVVQVDVPIRKRSMPGGVRRLAAALKAAQCDVVHTHMFWPSLYGCLAARLAGTPIVVTTEHGENRWKRGWHRWLERNLISRTAKLRFCVSPEILRRRRDDDGVPEPKLRVIANGTPVPAFARDRVMPEEPLLGSVGRLVRQKNFCLFVDAVAALQRKGLALRACIVGDGPERAVIEARIREHGLQEIFDLPGFDVDTDRWYRAFDVYVNSSSEEGQPVSILEAMAYSLPVVACNVGAISGMICDGKEGIIVAPSDIEAMTDALRRIVSDGSLAAMLGRHARQRVIDEFSIEAVAAQYSGHYHALHAGLCSEAA